ncbi:unnamed protein product [Phaedon cochleariae]|uniref:Uncharacterized protein n=1 Tax=Phaedon cochleariae TaxID=80249 RepID=A0A9N9X330_PHACE|nr:unnamed protein product [Phaedon cochleariae]
MLSRNHILFKNIWRQAVEECANPTLHKKARPLNILCKVKSADYRSISFTTIFQRQAKNDPKNSGTTENEIKAKPVLEVISPNLRGEEKQNSTVDLENIKEKSLQEQSEDETRKQILSTESIKKLKDKIIGRPEKEGDNKNIFTVKRRLRDYRREMGKATDVLEEESGLMGRSGKVVITAIAMKTINDKIDNLRKKNEKLTGENRVLKRSLHFTEKRTKKYNLVIYNLKGDNPLENVAQLFQDKLNIPCHESELRDAFRLGHSQNKDKPAPILVYFLRNKLKTEVLSNANRLRNTGIYISLDYTTEEYCKKKNLMENQQIAREQGKSAKIKRNSLIIEGVVHRVEQVEVPFASGREQKKKESRKRKQSTTPEPKVTKSKSTSISE